MILYSHIKKESASIVLEHISHFTNEDFVPCVKNII